ncbi:MAG: amidohydrolase [Thermodesulfobacteriota bacterium]|nr:amidohydrolase [Thermodesulfobacteriota bacterium]
MKKRQYDLLIRGGTVLTMAGDVRGGNDVIEDARIGINKGKIDFVGSASDPDEKAINAREVIDCPESIIMPGLVNTHAHMPMACFRGLADDLALMDWLNNYIFPAESRFVSSSMAYWGSMLAAAEMLLSGTTTVADGYFFEYNTAQAIRDAGMRGVLCQGFVGFPTPDNPNPDENTAQAKRFIQRVRDLGSSRIVPGLFCHSAYTCSIETMQAIKTVARQNKVHFFTHLSETLTEVDLIQKMYSKRPVQHLESIGVLDEHTVAAHCVWLDQRDIKILRDTGTGVSHNPESNMKLASGVAPVPQMLSEGIRPGLGTDGAASNNDLDMFGEMRTAAMIHKVSAHDPTLMDARSIVKMATIDGARVLGLDDVIGSIETGKDADIIVVSTHSPHLVPMYDPFSHIVYSASGPDVSCCIIQGRVVMDNRQIPGMDLDLIMKKVREIADRIRGI